MAMTPEQKREAERLRKANQRKAKRESTTLTPVPPLPPDAGTNSGTNSGTSEDDPDTIPATNGGAINSAIELLNVPPAAYFLVSLARTYAKGLDDMSRVPQHAALGARLAETMKALTEASKPKEISKLGQIRLVHGGSVGSNDARREA